MKTRLTRPDDHDRRLPLWQRGARPPVVLLAAGTGPVPLANGPLPVQGDTRVPA